MKKINKYIVSGSGILSMTTVLGVVISCGPETVINQTLVDGITKVEIVAAIEATYSNKGAKLTTSTADQPSVKIKGATVTYTITNNNVDGKKNYTINSIILNGIAATQALGPLGGEIVGFLTADQKLVNEITKAEIVAAIEATYSDKGVKLTTSTVDQPSVKIKGATVTYTTTNNNVYGKKNYTINSIILNGTAATQALEPLGGEIVGFLIHDQKVVNEITKAEIVAAIEATYYDKGTKLATSTVDLPSVKIKGATVTYTTTNNNVDGKKNYTINSIILNGTAATQALGPLGGEIVGFLTADQKLVNEITKVEIAAAIEATYSNKGNNLATLTADPPSVQIKGATVAYTITNNNVYGKKNYTINSIILNGTVSTQALGPLGGEIVGFLTDDQKLVNEITKVEIAAAIEATYSNKGNNLATLTADQSSVQIKGATVAYTITNNNVDGKKNYTINFITLNGTVATQALRPLGGEIVGFLTADQKLVNGITKAEIKAELKNVFLSQIPTQITFLITVPPFKNKKLNLDIRGVTIHLQITTTNNAVGTAGYEVLKVSKNNAIHSLPGSFDGNISGLYTTEDMNVYNFENDVSVRWLMKNALKIEIEKLFDKNLLVNVALQNNQSRKITNLNNSGIDFTFKTTANIDKKEFTYEILTMEYMHSIKGVINLTKNLDYFNDKIIGFNSQ